MSHKHCIFCGEPSDVVNNADCYGQGNTMPLDTSGHRSHVYPYSRVPEPQKNAAHDHDCDCVKCIPFPQPAPPHGWVEAAAADDPVRVAWDRYKSSDSFANSKKWAMAIEYNDGRPIPEEYRASNAEGSLWAAFVEGFNHTKHAPTAGEEGNPCKE